MPSAQGKRAFSLPYAFFASRALCGIRGGLGPKDSFGGGVDESLDATKLQSHLYLFETALEIRSRTPCFWNEFLVVGAQTLG
jgi:hypothetical protein